jgi:predicted DNA-binding transcriptional regulator AlpA
MEHSTFDDYRKKYFITVEELSEIMRLSRSATYNYVKSSDCPFYREQIGKRIVIPTKSFFQWYDALGN